MPTVALVGYTNAGKSTLFNALTGSATFVADQLFATLDPTVRRVKLAGVGEVVLADTVGFVRALPHELVAAFRSTLQEARDADLLLHVVDASDPLRDERIVQVREVLRGIGAGEIRELVVFNKIDLVGEKPRVVHGADGVASLVSVSAVTGRGLAGAARGLGARRASESGTPHPAPRTARGRRPLGSVPAQRRAQPSGSARTAAGSWHVELDLTEVAKLLGSKGVNLVDNPGNGPRPARGLSSLVGAGSAVRMRRSLHIGTRHGLERTRRREAQSLEPSTAVAERFGRCAAQFPAPPVGAVRARRRRGRRRRRTEFRQLRHGLEQHSGADRRRVDRQRPVPRRCAGTRRGAALRQVSADHRSRLQLAFALADRAQDHRQRVAPVQRRRRCQHADGRYQSGRGQIRGSIHPARRAQIAVQGKRRRGHADPGQRKRDARGGRPGLARQGPGVRSSRSPSAPSSCCSGRSTITTWGSASSA